MIKEVVLTLLVSALAGGRPAEGATLSLDARTQGNASLFSGTYAWDSISGNYHVNYLGTYGESRNFFVFDLANVAGTITAATLELQTYLAAGAQVGVFDAATHASVLSTPALSQSAIAAVYSDLGSGPLYGSLQVAYNGGDTHISAFSLNDAAVTKLNASRGGAFALGGAIVGGCASEIPRCLLSAFELSSVEGTQRLVLEVSESQVPEPISLLTVGTGIIGFVFRRRMRA